MMSFSSVPTLILIVTFVIVLECQFGDAGGGGADSRRAELASAPPLWNRLPPARLTNRVKGDLADLDLRGSVRYNIGPNGRMLRGIITKHREVPVDDEGTGVFQAKEECCHQDSYED